MSPALVRALQGLLIASGLATAVVGAVTMRWEDWPIYAVYLVLSLAFTPLDVEVIPGLALPIPSLALSLGFLYVVGPPIVILGTAAPVIFGLVVPRIAPAGSWRAIHAARLWGRLPASGDRAALAADWAAFAAGLGVRWVVASALATGERPTADPLAIIAAEIAGYGFWTICSLLPVLSFGAVVPVIRRAPHRPLRQDLGLIMIQGLTPFVFLIAYGYQAHGLPGAAGWSFASIGLHVMLRRLNDRRVRLEELHRELAHRERLSAIGKTSTVLSHQILQQLGVIGIHADLIRQTPARDGDGLAQAQTHAGAIEDALAGVDRVLRDLLVFSKDPRLNLYEHGFGGVVGESMDECRPFAEERGVRLRLLRTPEGAALLDKLKVKQAVVNVVRNAIEATPPAGEVVVDAWLTPADAVVAVVDHGLGIPAGDRERVFAPFYTTKEHGTGLGLAIAREFVVAHEGTITVEDEPAGGTRVVLRLPRRPDAAVPGPTEPRADSAVDDVRPTARRRP
jgi:signal transduction histidine kinase